MFKKMFNGGSSPPPYEETYKEKIAEEKGEYYKLQKQLKDMRISNMELQTELDKQTMLNETLQNEIAQAKRIYEIKKLEYENELKGSHTTIMQTIKSQLEDKKRMMDQIIRANADENTRLVNEIAKQKQQLEQKLKEISAQYNALVQADDWIQKYPENIPMKILEQSSSKHCPPEDIMVTHRNHINFDHLVDWNKLTDAQHDLWHMRACSYMTAFDEGMTGKDLHTKCRSTGYCAHRHMEPKRIKNGSSEFVLPCICVKCLWTSETLSKC